MSLDLCFSFLTWSVQQNPWHCWWNVWFSFEFYWELLNNKLKMHTVSKWVIVHKIDLGLFWLSWCKLFLFHSIWSAWCMCTKSCSSCSVPCLETDSRSMYNTYWLTFPTSIFISCLVTASLSVPSCAWILDVCSLLVHYPLMLLALNVLLLSSPGFYSTFLFWVFPFLMFCLFSFSLSFLSSFFLKFLLVLSFCLVLLS